MSWAQGAGVVIVESSALAGGVWLLDARSLDTLHTFPRGMPPVVVGDFQCRGGTQLMLPMSVCDDASESRKGGLLGPMELVDLPLQRGASKGGGLEARENSSVSDSEERRDASLEAVSRCLQVQ